MSKANLLFMDESVDDKNTYQEKNPGINFGALTGILIPVNILPSIQTEIYQLIKNKTEIDSLDMKKLGFMLHGSDFMPSYNDEVKINVISGLIDIIVKNKIKVFRACYVVSNRNMNYFYPLVSNAKKSQVQV